MCPGTRTTTIMCTRSAGRTCTRDGRVDVGGPGGRGSGRGTAGLGAGSGAPGATGAPGDLPGPAGPRPRHHLVGRGPRRRAARTARAGRRVGHAGGAPVAVRVPGV